MNQPYCCQYFTGKDGLSVEFKVRVFLDGTLVKPSDYSEIVIANQTVDRIVNEIYETSAEEADDPVA